MSELKPCPFCGSKAITTTSIDPDDFEYMPIEVNDCDAEVTCENERCINGWYLSPKAWNTRPIEDALNARIAELSQAVGLITTMKPTMVMDANHPLDMVREVGEHVNAQVVALTAALREANEDAARLAHSNTWVQVDDDGISAACIHCGKHAKYERDVIHRPDCPITLHRARVGGAA